MQSYYNGINFSDRNELQAELTELITSTHRNQLTYTPGVWNALLQSDLDPEDPSKVLLIYGFDDNGDLKNHRTRDKELRNTGGCGNCNGRWEREHVFAQSLATPSLSTSEPGTGTDAHNLRAVDRQMNSYRSNNAYTNFTGNATIVNGSGFYPGDEWIGDVARVIMYMYVRYETQCLPNNIAFNSTNISSPVMPDLFLNWNRLDPPSEFEVVRNEVIATHQGNRNPFIDNPYLATLIWGGENAVNFWGDFMNTSDQNVKDLEVVVTPNPTSDEVTIINSRFKSANLYTINGELIQSNLKNKFSIAQHPKGVYIIAIKLDNGIIVSKKIIKK